MILELFSLEKRLGLKINYLKRQGQGSGATGRGNGKNVS
jgi:hypothetical protein